MYVGCKTNRPLKLLPELKLIDVHLREVSCVGVVHVFREANVLAYHLAKEGCGRAHSLWDLLVPV